MSIACPFSGCTDETAIAIVAVSPGDLAVEDPEGETNSSGVWFACIGHGKAVVAELIDMTIEQGATMTFVVAARANGDQPLARLTPFRSANLEMRD